MSTTFVADLWTARYNSYVSAHLPISTLFLALFYSSPTPKWQHLCSPAWTFLPTFLSKFWTPGFFTEFHTSIKLITGFNAFLHFPPPSTKSHLILIQNSTPTFWCACYTGGNNVQSESSLFAVLMSLPLNANGRNQRKYKHLHSKWEARGQVDIRLEAVVAS